MSHHAARDGMRRVCEEHRGVIGREISSRRERESEISFFPQGMNEPAAASKVIEKRRFTR